VISFLSKNFNELVKRKKEEFYGLIDDETALLLVLKELGIKEAPRIVDLFVGFPIKELNVKILRKLVESRFKVYEVCDETAKARLITNKDLEEGSFVKLVFPKVTRNKYLTLISNRFEEGSSFEVKHNIHYVGEYIAKVLSESEILTDDFQLIRCEHGLEPGKYYHVKILFSRPPQIIYFSELSLLEVQEML